MSEIAGSSLIESIKRNGKKNYDINNYQMVKKFSCDRYFLQKDGKIMADMKNCIAISFVENNILIVTS